MHITPLRSARPRVLFTAICMAGLATLSTTINAAEPETKRHGCEPITKACNHQLTPPRQAVVDEKVSTGDASKRNRCEPITKSCIYRPATSAPATSAPAAVKETPPASAPKRNRCEPPTKACIYR